MTEATGEGRARSGTRNGFWVRALVSAVLVAASAAACAPSGGDTDERAAPPQRPGYGAPSEAALDLGSDARSAQVDAYFARYSAAKGPGCAVGVSDAGERVHARAYGFANLEHDVPLSTRSVFRIASVSKQFTAAAVLLAVEDGLIDLDAGIGAYLPELDPSVHGATVRQVIAHMGGLPDYEDGGLDAAVSSAAGGPFRYGDEDYLTTAEFFDVTTHAKLINPPGTTFYYSNIGYFWLAQIVERATGLTLRDYAGARLFAPAGMTKTQFYDDVRRLVPERATGYRPTDEGAFEIYETNLDWVGDGGVYTSVDDFFAWDRQFREPTLGQDPEAFRQTLITPLTDASPHDEAARTYAFGLEVSTVNGDEPVISHSGGWVAFATQYRRFPKRDIAYWVFCNRPDADLEDIVHTLDGIYAPPAP